MNTLPVILLFCAVILLVVLGFVIFNNRREYKKFVERQQRFVEENAALVQKEQHQRRVAESLRQAMLVLSSNLDHKAVVTEILRQIRELIYYDSAGFYLKDGNDLRLDNGAGLDPAIINSRIPLDSGNRTAQAFIHKRVEIIPDVRLDPYWQPFSPDRPVITIMAAPLVVGQKAIGALTIDRFESQAFTDEDAQTIQAFANQAAIAFRNAQLYQQAQTVATLEERQRLAQELHDAVNQTLFSASIIADALPDILKDPEQGSQAIEELRLLTQGALAEMRALLVELRPAAIIEKKFGELLKHLVDAFTTRTRIPTNLKIKNDGILSPEIQITFYRIVQEALVNITKHAKATQVEIRFERTPKLVRLSVQDDGRGFDANEIHPGHYGLTIMHERAKKIGAKLSITSEPESGFDVLLTWKRGANQ